MERPSTTGNEHGIGSEESFSSERAIDFEREKISQISGPVAELVRPLLVALSEAAFNKDR